MSFSESTAQQETTGTRWSRLAMPLGLLALALFLVVTTFVVYAGEPLSIAGYADFSYGSTVKDEPTAKEPESKAWWNDGYWWAVLFNDQAGAYHIYRLDATNNDWIDTGVAVDDRPGTRADVLWDDAEQKLYVASHIKQENPSMNTNSANWGRLYRFSYDAGSDSYTLDPNFPANVNESVTEALVLDKDSTGRLWVTYVTREAGTSVYEVYVNHSTTDDLTWGAPYKLPFDEATVTIDDISALVAFEDDEGAKVGVMWSNQAEGHDRFYFATRSDAADPGSGNWTLDSDFTTAITVKADDHINFATPPTGQLFAVIKTGADPNTAPNDTLIGVVARDSDGSYALVEVSPAASLDTSPIILSNDSGDEVYVFTATKTDGGSICQFTAAVTAPLSNMAFDYNNCPPAGGEPPESLAALFALADAPPFIADGNTYFYINNPASTKQTVGDESGIMVLANDEPTEYYLHNLVGGTQPPPPPPTDEDVIMLPVILKNMDSGGQ